jgi:hypothetical protein
MAVSASSHPSLPTSSAMSIYLCLCLAEKEPIPVVVIESPLCCFSASSALPPNRHSVAAVVKECTHM